MKQKILSGILAGVMSCSVIPMAVGAAGMEPKITFSDATYAKVGDKIEITVSIKNNPGFVSATIPVQWDQTKLKLDRVDETGKIKELLADGVTPYGIEKCGWLGYDITDEVRESGLYHLAWNYDTMHDGKYGELEFTDDGALCVMVFEVIEEIKEGTVITANSDNAFTNVMDFEMKDLVKQEDTGVTIIFGESKITLAESSVKPEGLLGDINADGNIKAVDAAMVYAMANGRYGNPTELQRKLADVNGDGAIKAVDAAMVYAKANGRLQKFPAEQ